MSALSPRAASVVGDFVFAFGPAAGRFVDVGAGFELFGEGDVRFALRGDVQRGTQRGTEWFALADLVDGDLAAGVDAIDGATPQAAWRGRFVQVAWRAAAGHLVAVSDHFSTLSVYALERDSTLLLSNDLRLITRSPACTRELDKAAIYHYLNFGCIPAPHTICRDIRRLTPGSVLSWSAARATTTRYFLPTYPEDLGGSDAQLSAQLRNEIVADVEAYRPTDAAPWGCFLSGGTDSSSIVSILSSQDSSRRVNSFSIGFAEAGYDELAFADLVARRCGAQSHTARVDPAQAIALLTQVVSAYDQPFGNASAVPTMACAELASAQSVRVLLAGDGGDEIFGGNERYAKDQVMSAFYRLPKSVKSFGNAIGRVVGGGSSHFLNRVENFFERASLPNPERFYTDDSFGSDYYDSLLTPEFRTGVRQDASLEFMREVYDLGSDASDLHRIMRLDLLMAIAQNDLVKVHGACRAHGISVRFPYLDPRLVEFLGHLPPRHKVRGLNKRHLFKLAMAGILPDDVLRKKKQGFGLPIAVWLRSDVHFQQLVRDVLFDLRTRQRGIFQIDCVERLIVEHAKGSWDHSSRIWQLLVLELWFRSHLDVA